MSEFDDIIDKMIVQLKLIDTEQGYNFTLADRNISEDFVIIDSVTDYPFVCFASLSTPVIEAIDQITYDVPFVAELFGYVNQTGSFRAASNLFDDIKKCMLANPELDRVVRQMKIGVDISTFEDFGVCLVKINGVITYINDQ